MDAGGKNNLSDNSIGVHGVVFGGSFVRREFYHPFTTGAEMARTMRSVDLDTRNKRLDLKVGKEHYGHLSAGCYIIYYRPVQGNGVWRARWRGDGGTQRTSLGSADDYIKSDGIRILSWDEASKKAGEWFRERGRLAHLKETGEVISDKPFTVADALAEYQKDIDRRGRPVATVEAYSRTRIHPALGAVEVGKLTRKRISDWHMDLAQSPRRKTGRGTSEARDFWETEPTDDQKRARRNTANRILAILKRALNLCVERGLYSGTTPWREVKPFPGVVASRVRFLSQQEQERLVKACPPGFRELVLAALYTGSRYAPLCRLQVKDFNPKTGTLYIARDKGKGKDTSRHVELSDEAIKWFKALASGRDPEDLLLIHPGSSRTTRKGIGEGWQACDQSNAMRLACTAAEIDPLTFHELRHTYASGLVNAGVPLVYVAAQLGHANTRMVELHYGHLCPSALRDSIRTLAPRVLGRPKKTVKLG
jgi:integrase